jgi:LTXXQ motif family protein
MIRNRSLWAVLPIAWMVACQANVSDGTATATTATPVSPMAAAPVPVVPAPAAANPHNGFRPHGGPATVFLEAAHDLTLTAPQQGALDTLETTLRADDDAIHTAMKAFHADLSAGVKAGAIDTAKLGTESAAVDRAMADHRTKEVAALAALHTLVDPTQRAALIAAVRAKQAEHEARMESWKTKQESGGRPDWQKQRLDKLTEDLALDADQQQQVAAILAQAEDPAHAAGKKSHRDGMRQQNEALRTAFGGDRFDAAQAESMIWRGKGGHASMTSHMVSFVSFVSQVLPILHPDQRGKLASRMESGRRGPGGLPDDMAEPAAGASE